MSLFTIVQNRIWMILSRLLRRTLRKSINTIASVHQNPKTNCSIDRWSSAQSKCSTQTCERKFRFNLIESLTCWNRLKRLVSTIDSSTISVSIFAVAALFLYFAHKLCLCFMWETTEPHAKFMARAFLHLTMHTNSVEQHKRTNKRRGAHSTYRWSSFFTSH